MIKDKLLNNILFCRELLDDFESEVEKIGKSDYGYITYYNCNKNRMNRSRIIIGEKLLEIEKAVKEDRQEI